MPAVLILHTGPRRGVRGPCTDSTDTALLTAYSPLTHRLLTAYSPLTHRTLTAYSPHSAAHSLPTDYLQLQSTLTFPLKYGSYSLRHYQVTLSLIGLHTRCIDLNPGLAMRRERAPRCHCAAQRTNWNCSLPASSLSPLHKALVRAHHSLQSSSLTAWLLYRVSVFLWCSEMVLFTACLLIGWAGHRFATTGAVHVRSLKSTLDMLPVPRSILARRISEISDSFRLQPKTCSPATTDEN